MIRHWLPFLIAGVAVVGIVAFLHSSERADALLAIALFVAISFVGWEPLRHRGSGTN